MDEPDDEYLKQLELGHSRNVSLDQYFLGQTLASRGTAADSAYAALHLLRHAVKGLQSGSGEEVVASWNLMALPKLSRIEVRVPRPPDRRPNIEWYLKLPASVNDAVSDRHGYAHSIGTHKCI